MLRTCRLLGFVGLCYASIAAAGEIDFIEDYALAPDRAAVLNQLVPGTDAYYYYHALYALQTEKFAQIEPLLAEWVVRHGETPRVWEIRNRFALLTYEADHGKSLGYLRNRLNLHYPHQRESVDQPPNLPTSVDPKWITREALAGRWNGRIEQVDQTEDNGLTWLLGRQLSPEQRRRLLQRLTRPDVPKLVEHIIEDLKTPHSAGFGSLPIHLRLTLTQLTELRRQLPDIINNDAYVRTVLRRLRPGIDQPWRREAKLRDAYLAQLWNFVKDLPPNQSSLKANVLYHQLVSDHGQGRHDLAKFIEYLKLPRHQGYVSPQWLERAPHREHPVNLQANYSEDSLLPAIGGLIAPTTNGADRPGAPVGEDEPLVREYLLVLLKDAQSTKEFDPYIEAGYLQRIFAETKIVNRLGDPAAWAAKLSPEQFQQLKDRVDLDFDPTNKINWSADEAVRLTLHIKNVPSLIVKVYEINMGNFYRTRQREVDTDINLDGLVPNEELSFQYDESPLRRVARQFDFPRLQKSGVYVVDFIGNGRSSRALIRKGRLQHLVKTTPLGQAFQIFDEQFRPVPTAKLWMSGKEYLPLENGTIVVPYSATPEPRMIVLSHGDFSSLAQFDHQAENYQLEAGFYVDRESLLARHKAKLLIRPSLKINGIPVSLKRLEDVSLSLVATDMSGTMTVQKVPKLPIFEDRETSHEFQVPDHLLSLSVILSATTKTLGEAKPVALEARDTFRLNEIIRTDKIEDLHLGRFGDKYYLELLGRTGEAKVDRAVTLILKHRDFRDPLNVTLKTGAMGRIDLGPLAEITQVTANGPEGTSHTWNLAAAAHTYPAVLHAATDQVVQLPCFTDEPRPNRDEIALFELRPQDGNADLDHQGAYVSDLFEKIAIKDGMYQIAGLVEGDYELVLKRSAARVLLRITSGDKRFGFVVGTERQLVVKPIGPVQVERLDAGPEKLKLQLRNVNPFARVHVYATRYLPGFSPFDQLARVRDAAPSQFFPPRFTSLYLTGRDIGDEYRYIIDRRYTTKYPGNMLQRPSLLLNPWAVRSTSTGEQNAAEGGVFGGLGGGGGMGGEGVNRSADAARLAAGIEGPSQFAQLDFLGIPSLAALNLVPDKDGIVTIERDALAGRQHLHVLVVDPLNTTYRSFALADGPPTFADLRFLTGLDAKSHFTQQKKVSLIPGKQPFEVRDIATTRFELYDSLTRVFSLLESLHPDQRFSEFRFLLEWPTLKPEAKRALYSKYACHELNFFIHKKDPEFFASVVQPYLANKRHKTFVDRWLLQEDLATDLEPWRHGRLNIAEQILLGERIAAERPRAARRVRELSQLVPLDVNRYVTLFDSALLGDSLSVTNGLQEKAATMREGQLRQLLAKDAPAAGAINGPMSAAAAPAMDKKMEQLERRKAVDARSKRRDGKSDRLRELKESLADEAEHLDNLEFSDNGAAAPDHFYGMLGVDGTMDAENDQAGRQLIRQLYRKPPPTEEFAENNYDHLTIDQQVAALIPVSQFWRDYAERDLTQPFLSRHLTEASRNRHEMLLALAVLDLPFTAEEPPTEVDGSTLRFTPASAAIVFHEELTAVNAPPVGNSTILVSQNFYRHNDRYRQENGEQVDKFITDEFLAQVVYGGQVVVTNPTSSRQKLTVLLQVPRGSIPVLGSQATRIIPLELPPYHTQTLDFHFYFPIAGEYPLFPVHVAKNESLIAFGAPRTFTVVNRPTKVDTQSWEYVSQQGTDEEVLAFLNQANLSGLNLDKIAFRMRDRAMFERVTSLLAAQHVYSSTLWSYALMHDLPAAAQQFLLHADAFVNECGAGRLKSSLLTIDPIIRGSYEHLEYQPLYNARAHRLGKQRQIVNDRFHYQYHRCLKDLSYASELNDEDWLAVCYYLLLQDRVGEAQAAFAKVRPAQIAERIQYDYAAAYLNFFAEGPAQADALASARAMATKYAGYPVDRWRQKFEAILAQLEEVDGAGSRVVDQDQRDERQGQLAATEPSLEFKVEANQVTLNYQHLQQVRVNYYLMDVELLFSRTPFARNIAGQFSAIRPNFSQDVVLKADQVQQQWALPPDLANRNVLVEVQGAGLVKAQAYYANSLSVQTIENYGQVKVTHAETNKPVSKAYVKVYSRSANGAVRFYKDGYTDLRGRFDYASLSTNNLDNTVAFSILVLSDEHGAVIREVAPPRQ